MPNNLTINTTAIILSCMWISFFARLGTNNPMSLTTVFFYHCLLFLAICIMIAFQHINKVRPRYNPAYVKIPDNISGETLPRALLGLYIHAYGDDNAYLLLDRLSRADKLRALTLFYCLFLAEDKMDGTNFDCAVFDGLDYIHRRTGMPK